MLVSGWVLFCRLFAGSALSNHLFCLRPKVACSTRVQYGTCAVPRDHFCLKIVKISGCGYSNRDQESLERDEEDNEDEILEVQILGGEEGGPSAVLLRQNMYRGLGGSLNSTRLSGFRSSKDFQRSELSRLSENTQLVTRYAVQIFRQYLSGKAESRL